METLYQWVLDMEGNIERYKCQVLYSKPSMMHSVETHKYVVIEDPMFDKVVYIRVDDGGRQYYVTRNEIGAVPSTFSSTKVLVTYEPDFEAAVCAFLQALERARDYHMSFVESFNKQIDQLLRRSATLV